jgi:glycosyltransferase involved in cell wall biosynthesis
MTVLHLISSEGFYGAEAVLVELALQTSHLGHRAVIGAFHDERNPHTEVVGQAHQAGLPAETVRCRGRWDNRVAFTVASLMRHHQADVLHTHGYKADVYGYLAARNSSVMLTSTCHNWPSRRLSMRLYAAVDRRLLREFHRVAAVSASVADKLLRSGFPRERLEVIPNGINFERFAVARRGSAPRNSRRRVGFVGRFVDAKGGASLLRAARTVLQRHPETEFIFAGDGPKRSEWEDLAVQSGIASNVRFLGVRNNMPEVYASLDMFVLPSGEEATPLCLLEAMAAGVPVIATPVGGVPTIIPSSDVGLLVEPGNEAALAEALLRMLGDPALASRIAANGQRRVSQEFSSAKMAQRYLELYLRTAQNQLPLPRE